MKLLYGLAIAALLLLAVAVKPLLAEQPASPQASVNAAWQQALTDLRERAGPGWQAKSGRSDRVLAGQPAPGDLTALDAEAAARGRGESALAIATLHASRRDRYLAGLARVDGARVRALLAIAAGELPSEARRTLDKEIAAALDALPAVE